MEWICLKKRINSCKLKSIEEIKCEHVKVDSLTISILKGLYKALGFVIMTKKIHN